MKLTDFDAVIFDMDGTLCHEDEALPGAAALVRWLNERDVRAGCLTNKSTSTPAELARRFEAMGIHLPAHRIFTGAQAMGVWIRRHWTQPRVFLFASRAVRAELGDDVAVVETADEPCDAVAVSTHMMADNVPFDLERAMTALIHLRRGAELVVACVDRVRPLRHGRYDFESGSWGMLFSYAANVAPERIHFLGKPDPDFYLGMCRRMGVRPERCLMVGDNLDSDIRGAVAVGMKSALLLTGVATRQDAAGSDVHPDFIFEDPAALLRKLGR